MAKPEYSYKVDKEAQMREWLRGIDKQRTKDAFAFLWRYYRVPMMTAGLIVVMFVTSVILWTLILMRSL